MADVEHLVLQMSADVRKLEKAMAQARAATERRMKEIEDRVSQMTGRVARSGDAMAESLKRSIAAIGVAAAVKDITAYADSWTRASNLLAAAGVQQDKVAETQNRLVDLALRTRTGLEATTETYVGLTRATATLGVTQTQVARATEIINEAFKVGGASVSEQTSSILQLKQALSSGVLQGQELNSIRENAPLIAKAIADEFGVTIGQLKALGEQGKLTSDRVFSGILKAGAAIDAQFKVTRSTVGEAFTNLQTKAAQYVGQLDQVTGASAKLAGLINVIARSMDLLGAAAIATAVVMGPKGLAGAFDAVTAKIVEQQKLNESQKAAVAERLANAKKEAEAASLASAAAIDRGLLTRSAVETTRLVADASAETVAAYKAEQEAIIAVERARAQLAATNIAAGASEGRILSQQTAVAKAAYQLREAEFQLAALRKSAPAALGEYRAAVTALNASLEAEALTSKRLVASQIELTAAQAAANVSSSSLRSALAGLGSFLSGPVGTVAVIVGLTFALQAFNQKSESTSDIIGDVRTQLDRYREVQGAIASDTAKLEDAQKRLTQALRDHATAAAETARTEITAIQARITQNQELAKSYKAAAAARLAVAQGSLNKLDEQGRRRISTRTNATFAERDAWLIANVERRPADTPVNELEMEALTRRSDRAQLVFQIQALKDELGQLDKVGGKTIETVITKPAAEAADSLQLFQTDLEKFHKALDKIEKAPASPDDKSRATVQAVLDYTEATKDALMATLALNEAQDRALISKGDTDNFIAPIIQALSDKNFQETLRRLEELQDGHDPAPFEPAWEYPDTPREQIDAEAEREMRDTIKRAVQHGFSDGIRTGDWGEALRYTLSDVLSSVLDRSIEDLVDAIFDASSSTGGSTGSGNTNWWGMLISAVGSYFSGARATGGPVAAGGTYLVGERGPEILRMGSSSGQVLTAAQVNGLSATGGRGGAHIDARTIFNGPVDATTLPQLQRMLDANNQKIFATFSPAIEAKVGDMQKRRRL